MYFLSVGVKGSMLKSLIPETHHHHAELRWIALGRMYFLSVGVKGLMLEAWSPVIPRTYREHAEHGLGYVERVPPVVVDHVPVVFSHCQQPSAQRLESKQCRSHRKSDHTPPRVMYDQSFHSRWSKNYVQYSWLTSTRYDLYKWHDLSKVPFTHAIFDTIPRTIRALPYPARMLSYAKHCMDWKGR